MVVAVARIHRRAGPRFGATDGRTPKPACVEARKPNLLRRPTGLADGLALKEPAPPLAVGSPPKLGSPAPRMECED